MLPDVYAANCLASSAAIAMSTTYKLDTRAQPVGYVSHGLVIRKRLPDERPTRDLEPGSQNFRCFSALRETHERLLMHSTRRE